jgi:hypothetical protein
MDPETLNRAIEIIQADPKSYGIEPNAMTTPYSIKSTIQIGDGPVENYDEYNNRLKQEKEQRALDAKNFNYTDWYNGLPDSMRDRIYETHYNRNPNYAPSYHQQDFDDMIKSNSQEDYDAMMRARQPSPSLLAPYESEPLDIDYGEILKSYGYK